jgi:serine/threonine-protein kinase
VLYEMLTGSVPFGGDTPLEVAMQHLSAVPEPPSAKRSEIPHELDAIVLRALAKDTEQRYRSARDMDADLARFAQGLSVSPTTEDAATAVLAGAGVTAAATTVLSGSEAPTTYRRSTDRYYDYDRAVRRRPFWPWLLAALLVVAAGFAAYYVYDRLSDEFGGADTVSVPFVEGKLQSLAVDELQQAGLVPQVRKRPNASIRVGEVFEQEPSGGEEVETDSTVVIVVSTGVAKTTVPDVVGESRDDAVAALSAAGLDPDVTEVYSEKPVGQVTAQKPGPGTRLARGETVFINVSRGIKLVTVPSVVGEDLDAAIAEIEDAGFTAGSPVFENSDEPENTVIGQDPAGNSQERPGTTIVLTVSRGPAQVPVPDVEGLDLATARATLRADGFRVSVVRADTDLVEEDGIVLAQSPAGGVDADPKSTVTLTVGRYVEPPPEETFPTETTETIPTDEEQPVP